MGMEIILNNIDIVQIVIFAYVGAFIGEINREVNDDEKMNILVFLSDLLSSGFFGVVIGTLFQQFAISGKDKAVNAISAAFGYLGHEKSTGIFTTLISQFTSVDIEDNKKE